MLDFGLMGFLGILKEVDWISRDIEEDDEEDDVDMEEGDEGSRR